MSVQSDWQDQQLERLDSMLAEAEAQEQRARAEWQAFLDKYRRMRRNQKIMRLGIAVANIGALAWNIKTGGYLLLPINVLGFWLIAFHMKLLPEDPLDMLPRPVDEKGKGP